MKIMKYILFSIDYIEYDVTVQIFSLQDGVCERVRVCVSAWAKEIKPATLRAACFFDVRVKTHIRFYLQDGDFHSKKWGYSIQSLVVLGWGSFQLVRTFTFPMNNFSPQFQSNSIPQYFRKVFVLPLLELLKMAMLSPKLGPTTQISPHKFHPATKPITPNPSKLI